jgi:GTP-binding protein
MIIHSAVLQASAPDLASCPPPDLPEFALIGRSNVGKSSLINMLTRRNGLARVSATPGKTRLINFFTINKKWNLVDLPGYGYAKVGRKQRAKFSSVIADFLKNRPVLQCTFVLLDSRLPPQEIDLAFLRWMVEGGLPVALIFTKADKLSQTAARKNIDAFLVSLREITQDEPLVLVSSSKDGKGRGEILGLVGRALAEGSGEFDS